MLSQYVRSWHVEPPGCPVTRSAIHAALSFLECGSARHCPLSRCAMCLITLLIFLFGLVATSTAIASPMAFFLLLEQAAPFSAQRGASFVATCLAYKMSCWSLFVRPSGGHGRELELFQTHRTPVLVFG